MWQPIKTSLSYSHGEVLSTMMFLQQIMSVYFMRNKQYLIFYNSILLMPAESTLKSYTSFWMTQMFSCCSFIGFTEILSRPRWDGVVWNINATCDQLGHHWRQILGMFCLTGSETTSYMYGKGKLSALNTQRGGNFPELYSALVELEVPQVQLMDAG